MTDHVEDGYRLYAETFADRPGNPFALSEEPDLSREDSLKETVDSGFADSISLVARAADGAAVGFVTAGDYGPFHVGVLPAWRQRGIGRALVTCSTTRLHGLAERAEVSVDANNIAAVQLFCSVGFLRDHRTAYFEFDA
jgi:mycothiol synthase